MKSEDVAASPLLAHHHVLGLVHLQGQWVKQQETGPSLSTHQFACGLWAGCSAATEAPSRPAGRTAQQAAAMDAMRAPLPPDPPKCLPHLGRDEGGAAGVGVVGNHDSSVRLLHLQHRQGRKRSSGGGDQVQRGPAPRKPPTQLLLKLPTRSGRQVPAGHTPATVCTSRLRRRCHHCTGCRTHASGWRTHAAVRRAPAAPRPHPPPSPRAPTRGPPGSAPPLAGSSPAGSRPAAV